MPFPLPKDPDLTVLGVAQSQINNATDALSHYRSMAGGSVAAGSSLLSKIKAKADLEFKQEWGILLKDEIIQKYGKKKICCPMEDRYTHNTNGKRIGYKDYTEFAVGSVSFDVPDYDVWFKTEKVFFGQGVEMRIYSDRKLSFRDEYTFNGSWHNPIEWFTDIIPSMLAVKGNDFFITGEINQNIDVTFRIGCWSQ